MADLRPIDIQKAILRDQGSTLEAIEVNRRGTKPRLGAPRAIDPKSLLDMMNHPVRKRYISDAADKQCARFWPNRSKSNKDLRLRRAILSDTLWDCEANYRQSGGKA